MKYLFIGLALSVGWQIGDIIVTVAFKIIERYMYQMKKNPNCPLWYKKMFCNKEESRKDQNKIQMGFRVD